MERDKIGTQAQDLGTRDRELYEMLPVYYQATMLGRS